MTPRTRLLTALRRSTPDRVPVTLYEYSRFNDDWPNRESSYAPLLELEERYGDSFIFLPLELPVFFTAQEPGRVQFEVAAQSVGSIVRVTTVQTPRGPVRSVARRDAGLMTSWQIEPLIKTDADIERVLALPDPPLQYDVAALRALAACVGERGVLCPNPGDAVGRVVGLFDYADFALRCTRDDAPIQALLARANDQLMRGVRTLGPHLENAAFRLWGPEYCSAPLLNPRRFFPRYVVPYDRLLIDEIHATGNFAIIHCHGMLDALLEMVVETGADALEPLETLPMPTADVTLADIKRRVGVRLCLMGAVQARTLEAGTPAEMEAEVRAALRDGSPGGGFVVLPTSAPFMVPLTARCLENAEVMYRTVHAHGRYT
ncbi:MAG: hypothetical protein IPM18_05825 [Phycisphaerales bacterium]|nr:hypothetical protein [Phycisphaerales bacterium]